MYYDLRAPAQHRPRPLRLEQLGATALEHHEHHTVMGWWNRNHGPSRRRRRVVTFSNRGGRVWRGCRGTARGTSSSRIPVHWVLSGHIPGTLVQAGRSLRRSSPLLIRGFRVRAPGAPPAKTWLVDLRSWDECFGVHSPGAGRCSPFSLISRLAGFLSRGLRGRSDRFGDAWAPSFSGR